ncbi:hypothetical protein B0H14DRAFT_2556547 [Mycena olivaceomarginata]|nr:hypothetical protein B0H14DRAFT_2556547 [Mycena olivaceomarginata]
MSVYNKGTFMQKSRAIVRPTFSQKPGGSTQRTYEPCQRFFFTIGKKIVPKISSRTFHLHGQAQPAAAPHPPASGSTRPPQIAAQSTNAVREIKNRCKKLPSLKPKLRLQFHRKAALELATVTKHTFLSYLREATRCNSRRRREVARQNAVVGTYVSQTGTHQHPEGSAIPWEEIASNPEKYYDTTASNFPSVLDHPQNLSSIDVMQVEDFTDKDNNEAQTHLYPSQELSLPLPSGYDVFAVARTPSLTFEKQWGGVVAIVRRSLGICLDDALSGPDLLVLKTGPVCIFGAYVLPAGSSWEGWSPVHPLEKLEQSVAVAKLRGDAVVVMGDLNGRTGCRRTSRTNHPSRFSLDTTVNTQGRSILQFGDDYGLRILNEDVRFGAGSWGWTFA